MRRNGSLHVKVPMMKCEEVDRVKQSMVFDINEMNRDRAAMITGCL